MDRISVDFDSLPKSIKRRELARLVDEYRNTQNEDARNRLIEVNLRMCWEFVYNYCEKIKCLDMFDELYAESIIALSQAIDDFDDEKCESFLMYAKKCILSHISQEYLKTKEDALGHLSKGKMDCEYVEDIYVDMQDAINEEILSQDFIDGVKKYLNKFTDIEQNVIKMFWGIECDRNYNGKEISGILNISLNKVYSTIKKISGRVESYISREYPLNCKEYLEVREMEKLRCSKKDIFYWYYSNGFNVDEIARMYKTDAKYIKKIILEYRSLYEKEELSELLENKMKKVFKRNSNLEHSMVNIFEQYYGINNYDCATINELIFMHKLSDKNILTSIVDDCKQKLLTRGLLEEDLISLDERRQDYFKISEYVYNSLNGESGCEKKTIEQLSVELEIPVYMLYNRINQYELSKNNSVLLK